MMIHKKLFTLIITSIICTFAQSQSKNIGIGTDNPDASAVLDVVATNKGFEGPNIALTSRTDALTIPLPADGLIVFNTTTLSGDTDTELKPSYYYWKTNRWYPFADDTEVNVVTNGVFPTILGYTPNGTHNSASFTDGGLSFTGLGCKQWTQASGGNGNWYCAFRKGTVNDTNYNAGMNWAQAFSAAKSRGGYLATFTSTAEWNWARTNLIENTTGYNLASHIWIGYNKIKYSGNTTEFTWITGEKSRVSWGDVASLPYIQHYFTGGNNPSEPNNTGGNEGCTHINSVVAGRDRTWNDNSCTASGYGGWAGPFSEIIIEFEQ